MRKIILSVFFIIISANLANADVCISLWHERNSHWNDAGLCFKTKLGRDVFDNSDCVTNDPFLKPEIVEAVNYLVGQERILGCSKKKETWTAKFILNYVSEQSQQLRKEKELQEEKVMAQGESSSEENVRSSKSNILNTVKILNLRSGMGQSEINAVLENMKSEGYTVKLKYSTPQDKFRTFKNKDGSFYILPRRLISYELKKIDGNLVDETSILVVPSEGLNSDNISYGVRRNTYYKKSSGQYFDIKKISDALKDKYGSQTSFIARNDSFYPYNFVYLDNTLKIDSDEKFVECFSWNKKPCLQKTKRGNYYSSCAFQSHKLNFRFYSDPKKKARHDRMPDCTGTVSYGFDRTFENTGTTQTFTVKIASYRIYFEYLKRQDQIIFDGLNNADNGRKGGDAPKL